MLSKVLSQYWSSKVRNRGGDYARNHRVQVTRKDPAGSYAATVRGSEPYDVEIEVERTRRQWRLGLRCSCPYGETHDGYCKHLWATIMHIETYRELLDHPSRVTAYLLDDEFGAPGSEDQVAGIKDAEVDEATEFLRLLPAKVRRDLIVHGVLADMGIQILPKSPPRPVIPPWQKFLNELATQAQSHSPTSRTGKPISDIVYVLDIGSSVYQKALVLKFAKLGGGRRGHSELALGPSDVPRLTDELDRRIVLMIVGSGKPQYDYYGRTQAQWDIDNSVRDVLVPLLGETGRLYYEKPLADGICPLKWDAGEPFEFMLSLPRVGARNMRTLTGWLRRGEDRRPIDSCVAVLDGEPGLVVWNDAICRARLNGSYEWMSALRNSSAVKISDTERARFLAALAASKSIPSVEWPAEWNIATVADVDPRPTLELKFDDVSTTGKPSKFVHGAVRFCYDDVEVAAGREGSIILDAERSREVHRRIESENKLAARVIELGMTVTRDDRLRLGSRQLPGLVAKLLDEGWTVFGNRALFRTAGEFKMEVSTGIDWFDLHGHMDFEGQRVALPALLAAARKGERFVRLDDGSMGMLPEQWLAKHQGLFGLGEVEGESVRFTRTQVGIVDVLLSQLPEASFDKQLATARKKFRDFNGVAPCSAPEAFTGHLRAYQEEGLGWLNFLREFGWNGCLADDMGLGKTIQVLALLADRKQRGEQGPSLVVMPKSLIFNWKREAARFTPQLNVIDYTGGEREQVRDAIQHADIVLTTYGTLRRDIEELREFEFNYVMLDEAQNAKNPTSLNAKCARLLNGKNRLALTGTPVENHVGDLWSLFEFLNPGMLGKHAAFTSAFRSPRNGDVVNQNTALLHRMLRPFILRRTKEQVAPELPERSEQVIECAMPPRQSAYYNELRDYYRKSLMGRVDKQGLNKSKVQILEALLRLRQAACHPGLIDAKKAELPSAKLETLFPRIGELIDGGHKALVFSQFTSLLAIVRGHLDKQRIRYEYLDGQTDQRQDCVDRFQNDADCPLFLISLKAGGVGLNLTAADYVFLLDPWWNPAVEAQAIDRTHRIGQDKKVIAYRLITRDTVESKIVELQQRKRDLAGAIITQANSVMQSLTREDLALLLS